MAESQKGASSSANPKEKKSLLGLDGEIGKEFLSSWKSMSVMEDEMMDFSFDTVPIGKKMGFNFGKLDDFNLDVDFDKLSSFKVNMSDLDFLCPSQKSPKSKERSVKESSDGNDQGNQDCFGFCFDLNALDTFNFDSTTMKGDKTSIKKVDSQEVASENNECQGSKVDPAGGGDAFDDRQTEKIQLPKRAENLPASEKVTTSIVETVAGGLGTGNSSDDNIPSRSQAFRNMVEEHGPRTLPKITRTVSAEETDQQHPISEKAVPTESQGHQTTQILPVQSLDGIDLTGDTGSDPEVEICSLGAQVNIESSAEHNDNGIMTGGVGSELGNTQAKNLSPLCANQSDSHGSESNNIYTETSRENKMETQTMADDLDQEATSTTSHLRKIPDDCQAKKDDQNSTSKALVPFRRTMEKGKRKFQYHGKSETGVDKVIPIKEKELGILCSRYFRRSEETVRQIRHPSSFGVEVAFSGSKEIPAIPLSLLANGKREGDTASEGLIGRKLIGDKKSLSRELTKCEPALIGREKNVRNPYSIREGLNADGVDDNCKLVVNGRKPDKEGTKGDPGLLGSEKNIKDLDISGCKVDHATSTSKATKLAALSSVNTASTFSSLRQKQNLTIAPVERIKAGRRTPDLSSLKLSSSTMASRNDQLNTTNKSILTSLESTERNVELQGNNASKNAHPVSSAERKFPVITSLKRKNVESPRSDIAPVNPPKRLSQSPIESRNFKEPLINIVEIQVNDDKQAESKTKNTLYDQTTSKLEVSREVNMQELEISLAIDDDGNVEKAEAYAKELEDICSILKKKHDEAKEILVRAIVNNNHLLMLNHPMFDEKIFAWFRSNLPHYRCPYSFKYNQSEKQKVPETVFLHFYLDYRNLLIRAFASEHQLLFLINEVA